MYARQVRTILGSIGLYEALSRACLFEFWCKPCQLREVLVDYADLRGEVVLVDILREMTSGVAQASDDQYGWLLAGCNFSRHIG